MVSTTPERFVVDASVQEFLVRHAAEPDFRKLCVLVHACFPELISLEATIEEDPDEEGRAQAVLRVKLPESYPDCLVQTGLRRYHERLVQELPLVRCPLFALVTDFSSE